MKRSSDQQATPPTQDVEAKRQRQDGGLQRLRDLDEVCAFVAEGTSVVVFAAGWEVSRSAVLQQAVTALQSEGLAKQAGVVRLDQDDVSGEMAFSLAVDTAPCVLVYRDGERVRKLTVNAAEQDAAASLQEKLRSELAPAVPSIASMDHFHELVAEESFTIFDFYADWCAPCNRIKPHLPSLMDTFPSSKFFKVDRDRYLSLHEHCNVQKIPTFQIYKGGQLKATLQHSDVTLVRSFIEEHTTTCMVFDDDF